MIAQAAALGDLDTHRLVQQARAGDTRAFGELYQQHVGPVYGLCLRMTANVAEAEDCTQQAFVSAWRKLDQYRAESALATWLHRIAVNTVLAAQRKQRDDTVPLHEVAEEALASWSAQPDADPALERAVAGLALRLRQVFVLHAVYGYGHKEIATQLGVAEGTVKAQYHQARQKLQQMLGATQVSEL